MDTDIDALIRSSETTEVLPDALDALGQLIDGAADGERLDGVEAALRWAERILGTVQTDRERALVHYFTANAYATRRRLSRSAKPAGESNDLDLANEVLQLRLAVQSSGFEEMHSYQQCQVLTNLGNALSGCGRMVEAIEWYDHALRLDPNFGMAVTNRGLVLVDYANRVHDPNRRNAVVRTARVELVRSLEGTLEHGAEKVVRERLAQLESRAPVGFAWSQEAETGTLDIFPAQDRQYRRWGLEQRLFLDELCDLGWAIGARDTLSLPGHVAPLGEGPRFIGFFNQMKQEFVAARWMLFEGLRDGPHPADAEVVLADTMDYPAYSFRTEELRMAFRSVYSLLDKIAFFFNHYLQLGVPDHKVEFRTIWFVNVKERQLRPAVEQALNHPLRALIWVGQDLFDPTSEYGAALLPDAQDLWELRRFLEHRYVKLHGEGWSEEWNRASWRQGLRDELARSLSRAAFADKALRLMKMVRAALMYLGWAMNAEEERRQTARAPRTLTPPMVLPPLPKPQEPPES